MSEDDLKKTAKYCTVYFYNKINLISSLRSLLFLVSRTIRVTFASLFKAIRAFASDSNYYSK